MSLTRSLRKYIRKEKSKIRRNFMDLAVRQQKIQELYTRVGFKR